MVPACATTYPHIGVFKVELCQDTRQMNRCGAYKAKAFHNYSRRCDARRWCCENAVVVVLQTFLSNPALSYPALFSEGTNSATEPYKPSQNPLSTMSVSEKKPNRLVLTSIGLRVLLRSLLCYAEMIPQHVVRQQAFGQLLETYVMPKLLDTVLLPQHQRGQSIVAKVQEQVELEISLSTANRLLRT